MGLSYHEGDPIRKLYFLIGKERGTVYRNFKSLSLVQLVIVFGMERARRDL